ncbi:uncharacterized protein LOC121646051 [Melanotaenia boesemani]|uniref:uncharacterized protein LOC121646051 n=1 Tax=Melanotaenia boesemani TaxID=1250792 RepID=UPI001C0530B6|nr:uncharacterized protein LOC121646051 [Melanotaenia boesemani]
MMMMPVYPGAPWLPKFKGPGGDLSYSEWKEQIQGLLGSQELTEAKKVDIVLGALAGEAKRQVIVLEDDEKDRVNKIFAFLDSLLRELYHRLRRHDPGDAPSDTALRDQLLLGLQEGPLAQALRVYARRHPDEDFAAVRKEALLLDVEHGRHQTEVICTAVNNSQSFPRPPQQPSWKESLKQEILEDVKSQMSSLAQELLKELKPLLQPAAPVSVPQTQTRRYRRRSQVESNQWDDQGRPICHRCKEAGHMARVCKGSAVSPAALN